MLTLIIEIFSKDTYISVAFTDKDFESVNRQWETADRTFKKVKKDNGFNDANSWSELSTEQWYYLTALSLEKVINLPKAQQTDHRNTTIKHFHFLIMGLKKCLEVTNGKNVELIKIQVFEDMVYNFQFHSSFVFKLKKRDKPNLSVVVDNTED